MQPTNYSTLLSVRKSIRYHESRAAFYGFWGFITRFLTILTTGSVLVSASGTIPVWLHGLALATALLVSLDLTGSFSEKAGLHKRLKDRFSSLETQLSHCDSEQPAGPEIVHARLEIERDEPPVFVALNMICHNAQLIAEGFDQAGNQHLFLRVTAWQRLTRHFWRWECASRELLRLREQSDTTSTLLNTHAT
jgi:hypothetical protein